MKLVSEGLGLRVPHAHDQRVWQVCLNELPESHRVPVLLRVVEDRVRLSCNRSPLGNEPRQLRQVQEVDEGPVLIEQDNRRGGSGLVTCAVHGRHDALVLDLRSLFVSNRNGSLGSKVPQIVRGLL